MGEHRLKADGRRADVVTVLGHATPQAREMLRKLLAGKISRDPTGSAGQKDRGHRFQATTLTLDQLVAGEATNRIRMALGGPNGICHLVGQYLRFPLKGTAFRT